MTRPSVPIPPNFDVCQIARTDPIAFGNEDRANVEGEGSPRHTGFDDKRDYDGDKHKADGGGRVVLR